MSAVVGAHRPRARRAGVRRLRDDCQHCRSSQCMSCVLCCALNDAIQTLSLVIAGIRSDNTVATVVAPVPPLPTSATAMTGAGTPADVDAVTRNKQRRLWRWRTATRRVEGGDGARAAGLAQLLVDDAVVRVASLDEHSSASTTMTTTATATATSAMSKPMTPAMRALGMARRSMAPRGTPATSATMTTSNTRLTPLAQFSTPRSSLASPATSDTSSLSR